LQPVSFSNLGDYTLKITACFTLSSNNGDSTFTGTDLCADSAPFVVSIVNPCETTTIEGEIFTDVMREPQLQTETLDLSARVPSGGWEWTTAVDSATAGSYGDNMCGLITYQVLEETSPGTYEAQNLVSKAGDILTFAPDLTHTPGPYNMVLVGTLASYPSVTYVKQFTVIVDDCEATISTAGVTIPNMVNTWYFNPATYSYTTQQLEAMVV